MADMRLIVAGAGGRMGRTLVKAIGETPGLVLAGATEGEGSPHARPGLRRARRPAAEPRAGDERSAPAHGCGGCDPRFHRSGRDREARGARRRDACSRTSSAPPACSAADDAKIAEAAKKTAIMKSGNMSLGVNLLAVMTQTSRGGARRGVRHRDRRDASQQEDRCALRHRAAVRRGRRGRPQDRPEDAARARARRPHRRAQAGRHRLRVACAAAMSRASTA